MSRFGHFSDIHFNFSNYDTNTLREELIEKLKELQPLDALFITGDIFYRGNMDDNSVTAVKSFIERMASAARCDIDKVFICAGNHDLERNRARANILHLIIDDYAENKVLTTDDYALIIYDKTCTPFNNICSSITGIDNTKNIHRFVPLEDINLVILNTSVFAGQTYPGQKDADKKSEDTNLFICDKKFEELRTCIKEKADKNKLTIFIGHHSPDCFAPDENKRLVKYIDDVDCDLYLCGHIHKPSTGLIENTNATYRITCGGPFKDEYNRPTFVIGDFNSYTNELSMELYCYENSWELDNQAPSPWKKGKWKRRIERLIKENEESKANGDSLSQTITHNQGDTVVHKSNTALSEKYFSYILHQSSEIQLDGLPTNEEDIIRSHQLSQIYIPEHFIPYDETDCYFVDNETPSRVFNRDDACDIISIINARKPIRSVILGDPGSGKTTLISWLVVTCCSKDICGEEERLIKSQNFFPVLIRCRDIKETTIWENISNTTRLAEWFPGENTEQLASLIKSHLDDGSALLLVDGLDEINDEGKRKAFIDQLHLFIKENDKANVIVTSRIKGYSIVSDRSFEDFSRWEITDLFPEDINKLCENWFCLVYGENKHSREQARELADKVTSDDRLNILAKNPLMLTTLLLVKRRVGSLPNKRAALYYEAVKVLLESWNSHVHEVIDIDEAKYQLSYVAFCMMYSGSDFSSGISKTYITGQELKKKLQAVRKDYESLVYTDIPYSKIIEIIEKRSAILYKAGTTKSPDGHEEPVYCFQHLLFEEYLTACAIAMDCFPGASDVLRDGKVLYNDLMNPDMREVISLTAAISPHCAANISKEALRLSREKGHDRRELMALRSILIQMIADEVSINKPTVQEALEIIFNNGIHFSDLNHIRQICVGKYAHDFIDYAKHKDEEVHFGNPCWYSLINLVNSSDINISNLLEKLRVSNNSNEKASALTSLAAYIWLDKRNSLDKLNTEDKEYITVTVRDCLASNDMHLINGALGVLRFCWFNSYKISIPFSDYWKILINYVNETSQVPYLLAIEYFSITEVITEINNNSLLFSEIALKAIYQCIQRKTIIFASADYKVLLFLMVICVFACSEDNESYVLDIISEVSYFTESICPIAYQTFEGYVDYYKKLIECAAYERVPNNVKRAFEQVSNTIADKEISGRRLYRNRYHSKTVNQKKQ